MEVEELFAVGTSFFAKALYVVEKILVNDVTCIARAVLRRGGLTAEVITIEQTMHARR